MQYNNLTIIGTSHIAKQSLDEVNDAVAKINPDIIAIELDKRRIYALMHDEKRRPRLSDIRHIGLKGFIFSIIGAWVEKKLGQLVGIKPGSEMKQAVKLAKKNKIRLALIDQDIEITLRRFSKTLTWKEKWNFLADIFKAVVLRKKEIDFDLRKVPDKKIIEKLMNQTRKRYPNIYKVLVTERNEVMANNLADLMEKNNDKKILAIVGAGHGEEILRIIKEPMISYSVTVG